MALDPGRNPIFGNISRGAEIGLLAGVTASLAAVVTVGIFMKKQAKLVEKFKIPKYYSYQSKIAEQQAKFNKLTVELEENMNELETVREAIKIAKNSGQDVKKLECLERVKMSSASRCFEQQTIAKNYRNAFTMHADRISDKAEKAGVNINSATTKLTRLKLGFKVAIGVLVIITAIYAGLEFWNYYHPHLKDIPLLMMDKKYDRRTTRVVVP